MRARFWSLCCLYCCAHIRQLEKSLCNDEHSPSHSLFHKHTHRASRLHSKNGENKQFFTATLDLICMCLSVYVFIKLMKIARHYFKLLTYIRVCFPLHSKALQCSAEKLSHETHEKSIWKWGALTRTHTRAHHLTLKMLELLILYAKTHSERKRQKQSIAHN